MNTRKQGMGWLAVLVGIGLLLGAAEIGYAVTYTWDTAPAVVDVNTTNNWSVLANWKDDSPADPSLAYPKSAGDTAKIWNTLPALWAGGTSGDGPIHSIVIDVADISGLNLDMRDDNPPARSRIRLQVNQNATFNRIDWFNDNGGSGRSDAIIASTKTLSVNYLNMTGRFPNSISGPGTLAFTPDGGGAATYAYFGGTEQMGSNGTYDHTAVTTMTYNQNGGGAFLEGRDVTWKVGNAAGNQSWNITGGGGPLRLVFRSTGGPFHFVKVGGNDVDMGFRTSGTPSAGVKIERGTTGDHTGVVGLRNLFTDATGLAMGGTVTIADYQWQETARDGTVGNGAKFMADRVGANLVINNGNAYLAGNASGVNDEDVNALWVMSGRSLTTSGDVLVDKSAVSTGTGRMGLLFEGATVNVGANLSILGNNTFLNGGATGGAINVAGSVRVNSRNPTGFSSIAELPTGLTATADDFNLMATGLTMNGGGGAKTFDWNTASALGGPALQASDFSLANFTLGSLALTNGTSVTFTPYRNLFLGSSLSLDATSSLNMYLLPWTGASHIYLQGIGQLAQIQGWIAGGQLQAAGVTQVGSVGLDIFGIPEPASLALLGFGALVLLRRPRKP